LCYFQSFFGGRWQGRFAWLIKRSFTNVLEAKLGKADDLAGDNRCNNLVVKFKSAENPGFQYLFTTAQFWAWHSQVKMKTKRIGAIILTIDFFNFFVRS